MFKKGELIIGQHVQYLEREMVGPTSGSRVDLHCSSFHGVGNHNGLVDVFGEDATLQDECGSIIVRR